MLYSIYNYVKILRFFNFSYKNVFISFMVIKIFIKKKKLGISYYWFIILSEIVIKDIFLKIFNINICNKCFGF